MYDSVMHIREYIWYYILPLVSMACIHNNVYINNQAGCNIAEIKYITVYSNCAMWYVS